VDQTWPAAVAKAKGEVLPSLGDDVRVEIDSHQRRFMVELR